MQTRFGCFAAAATIFTFTGLASGATNPKEAPLPFEDAFLSVVYNASDDDAQIVIRAAADDPIASLWIFGPGGRVRIRAEFRDGEQLGQAYIQFDTPEPSLEDLESAYPEGNYHFRGWTAEGNRLAARAELSYELLPAPTILYPEEGDTGIPRHDLEVRWSMPEEADRIRLEVEDEEEEDTLTIDLPGDTTSFRLPDAWLKPEVLYTLDVKLIAENGNVTVRDVRFVTAE